MHGALITIEGIDGCGKTTAAKAITAWAEKTLQIPPLQTRQPGGTKVGEAIRAILLNPENNIPKESELLLFCASFAASCQNILLPALQSGKWVICDRFTDSTRAYQGGGRGIDSEKIEILLKTTVEYHPLLVPKITFLLDITPETARKRIYTSRKNAGKDAFEKEGILFARKIRERFLLLAEKNPQRIKVLSSETLTKEELQKAVHQELDKLVAPAEKKG